MGALQHRATDGFLDHGRAETSIAPGFATAIYRRHRWISAFSTHGRGSLRIYVEALGGAIKPVLDGPG